MLGESGHTRGQVDRMFMMAAFMSCVSLILAAVATRGHRFPTARRRPPVLRVLRRYHPGAVLLVGMAMGLGIGVTATMFSFTHCILEDLPYDRPDELVNFSWDQQSTGREKMRLTMGEFTAFREHQSTLEGLASYTNGIAADEPEEFLAAVRGLLTYAEC